MKNKIPIVMVHGLFGFGPQELGPLNYWGMAMRIKSPQKKFEASVGPISSAHDRACELLAQIKGVRVDYGKEHSKDYGHKRYGKDYSGHGFHPEWSAENPVHLIGHSLGGPTIRCAQFLLAIDHYSWGSNEDWVRSITGIAPVHNGSTLTYLVGVDEQTGLIPKNGNISNGIVKLIEIYTAATGTKLDQFYDFDLNHWRFKRKENESVWEYLKRVNKSKFAYGKDNAVYSLTLQGAKEANEAWPTYPNTFYFNLICEQTHKGFFTKCHYPDWRMNAALKPLALHMGSKRFDAPLISKFNDSDWFENDGAVNVYSQMYPRISGDHPIGRKFKPKQKKNFKPGKWHWTFLRGWDHLDIILMPQWCQRRKQRKIYKHHYKRLAVL